MPPNHRVTRQWLLTIAAGLGVAALAGVAFALSYDDLRVLAITGGAAKRYGPIYPIMLDTLVVVTILSLVVARRTRWWTRGVRWLLLLVLLVGAAAASVQRAVESYDSLPDNWLSAGVASAPWVMLLLAVWLWLSMFKQARIVQTARSVPAPADEPPPRTDEVPSLPTSGVPPAEIVPGLAAETATEPTTPPVTPSTTVTEPDPPAPPQRAPATLPTDVKLVARSSARMSETTQPDLVLSDQRTESPGAVEDLAERGRRPVGTQNAEQSVAEGASLEPARHPPSTDTSLTGLTGEDDVERWSAVAAEDARRWAEEAEDTFGGDTAPPDHTVTVEWTPPSSKFRSSPTPPRD